MFSLPGLVPKAEPNPYGICLGYFRSQMEKSGIPMRLSSEFTDIVAAPSAAELDEIAEHSESLEQRIASLNDSYETLKKREVELTEWRWVLREAGGFFDRVRDIDFFCLGVFPSFNKLTLTEGSWPNRRNSSVF
jgi:hypothetical protein